MSQSKSLDGIINFTNFVQLEKALVPTVRSFEPDAKINSENVKSQLANDSLPIHFTLAGIGSNFFK